MPQLILLKNVPLNTEVMKFSVGPLMTLVSLTVLLFAHLAQAETLSSPAITHNYLTVEENIALMDTDKNGFADVMEVRAYLQRKHGADYEKERLDFLVSTAKGKSCSTPFAKALY